MRGRVWGAVVIETMLALFTAALGVAVVVKDARDGRDEPEPDFEFDQERAALEGLGDELDDPVRMMAGELDVRRLIEGIRAL